jgi:hypothetical protein
MDLPKRERAFYFDHMGEYGNKYDGHFVVKCRLNVAEKYQYELERSKLLGDVSKPTDGLASISSILAFLRSRIISGPNWWQQGQGFNIEEEEVLYALLTKVDDEISAWKQELASKVEAQGK